MISELDAIVRLFVAIVLGGIVGFERQSKNKTAGLRTHILVSLGSCLIMILSINVHAGFNSVASGDATRLAAQVVSGIGFLGAGTILANKSGLNVIGLTTAASLWTVAAVGLAAGAGYWITAGVTTVLVYLTLGILTRLDRRIGTCAATLRQYNFLITTVDKPGQIGKIGEYFGNNGINITEFHTTAQDTDKRRIDLMVEVEAPVRISAAEIVAGLIAIEGLVAVKQE